MNSPLVSRLSKTRNSFLRQASVRPICALQAPIGSNIRRIRGAEPCSSTDPRRFKASLSAKETPSRFSSTVLFYLPKDGAPNSNLQQLLKLI
jgi:hypothetical protein